jgi:hypothetical protein
LPGSVHIARCRSCFAVPIIRMLWRLCVARFATPWCLHALTLPNAVWSNCCTWPATLSRLHLPTHAWFLVPLPNDIGLQTGDRIRLDNVEQGCAEGQAPVQIRRGLTRWESPSPQFLLRSTNVWLLPRAPSSLSQVGFRPDRPSGSVRSSARRYLFRARTASFLPPPLSSIRRSTHISVRPSARRQRVSLVRPRVTEHFSSPSASVTRW